jgi:hypothetical protein
MNPAWAVDLLRRGARDVGALRLVKLYEAMEYLEERLDDQRWLVRCGQCVHIPSFTFPTLRLAPGD